MENWELFNDFSRMFQSRPETFQFFPQFQGLDGPEQQKRSEVFQEHSEKVKEYLHKQNLLKTDSFIWTYKIPFRYVPPFI